MDSAPRVTPKSVKFSSLQRLRGSVSTVQGAAAPRENPLLKDVRSALSLLQRQGDQDDFFKDANVKISRHQFAEILVEMREQITRYHSVGVFVEYMLNELQTKNDRDVATLAAASTWALNLLAQEEVGGALGAISRGLLPAIYCDYNPENLAYASAAIQVQLRDPTVVSQNPYFTHSMYVEQAREDHKSAVDMRTTLQRALQTNESGRGYVLRTVHRQRMDGLRICFNAWRQFTRRLRILQLTNERRERRHTTENSALRVRMAFAAWKGLVEVSRTSFLTDRLHEVAFQLENAKNQFQLQCYRTDRLIQTTKEAKSELGVVLATEGSLRSNIGQLQEELKEREDAYNTRLTSHIRDAFTLVKEYRDVISLVLDIRLPSEPYLQLVEDYESPNPIQLTAEIDPNEEDPYSILVQWCNYAVQQVLGTTYKPFKSIGPEFYSGEYYLIVMHFVMKDKVPLQPNRENNVGYRLRRIHEISEDCQLIYTLTPTDFTAAREDRMVTSLSELYSRYLANRRKECAFEASSKVALALKDAEERAKRENKELTVVTETDFHSFMVECSEDLTKKKDALVVQCVEAKHLAQNATDVSQQQMQLTKERRRGAPIRVLAESSRRNFWKVNYKAMDDMRNTIGIGSEAQLKQMVLGTLQMVLKKKIDITSRVFYFFAGENSPTMSEAAFWRFVESNTFHSNGSSVTKEMISHVFDKVVSPQLDVAIKAAAHGKSEKDAKTLLTVAQHEIDIRQIKPTQFILILLRISAERFRSQVSFTEGVSRFLDSLTVPSESTYPSIIQEFYSYEVRYVINYFSDDLFRIFFFYLKAQQQSKVARDRLIADHDGGRFASMLSIRSYVLMFDHCSFLDVGDDMSEESEESEDKFTKASTRSHFISPEQIEVVLAKVVAARTSIAATQLAIKGCNPEVTFTMFLESFGVFSHYWCADPFVPLARKVAAFISTAIRRLMKVHAQGTLVLGTPPQVGLDGGAKVNLSLSSAG